MLKSASPTPRGGGGYRLAHGLMVFVHTLNTLLTTNEDNIEEITFSRSLVHCAH